MARLVSESGVSPDSSSGSPIALKDVPHEQHTQRLIFPSVPITLTWPFSCVRFRNLQRGQSVSPLTYFAETPPLACITNNLMKAIDGIG
jgi:hypothetical protein